MTSIQIISKKESQKAPVFVVGEARSGSTILQRSLELHPVFRPRKIVHHESKIFSYTNRAHLIEMKKWTGPFNYMLWDEKIFMEFLQRIKPIMQLHSCVSSRPTIAGATKLLMIYWLSQNHHVVRSFFFYAQQARNSNRVVEKTPYNTLYIKQIKFCYPNSKLLYIHRHPVDVFSSYRKVAENIGHSSWAGISPEEFITLYKTRTSIALKWKEHKDFLLISYERFAKETEREWEVICRFLNIPSLSEPISVQYNPDRHESYEKYIKGPIVSKTKNPFDFMTKIEACQIEDSLKDFIEEFKYHRYT